MTSILKAPEFWGSFAGLVVGTIIALLIAVATVRLQRRSNRREVKTRAKNIVVLSLERTASAFDAVVLEYVTGRVMRYNLIDVAETEVISYHQVRMDISTIGERAIEREVDELFRRIRLALNRARAYEGLVAQLTSSEETSDAEPSKLEIFKFQRDQACNELRVLGSRARGLVGDVERHLA